MAQAQVTITAVDRTQTAINSAVRGMKTIERTAKVTARTVNLAFGFLTGGLIVSAFKKITDAAKKTEDGQRALLELNRTLKDPALIAAAEGLTNALVTGFAAAVKQASSFIKFVRAELISLGMIASGGTARDAAALIKGQIANKTMLAGQFAMAGPGAIKNVQIINAEINALRQQLALIEGLADAEAKAEAARIDAILAEEQALKLLQEVTINSKKTTLNAMQQLQDQYDNATATEMQKTLRQFAAFEAMVDSLMTDSADKTARMREELDKILPEIAVTGKREAVPEFKKATDQMQEFAKQAAASIQSSFADFLFDPFENGLRGMLSGFLNVIRRMIAEVAASAILNSIFGGYRGKGGVMGAFADALLPRAMGGPVSANTPYIVGERGPELFVPGTSGGIVPNNKLGMGGGVTVAPVYNIDARGATADLQRSLPGILQENNRRIFDELDRRYGIGR
jgi:hypothetical protein